MNGYMEILQIFFELMYRYRIFNLKIIHCLKYILKFNIQLKIFVIDCNG